MHWCGTGLSRDALACQDHRSHNTAAFCKPGSHAPPGVRQVAQSDKEISRRHHATGLAQFLAESSSSAGHTGHCKPPLPLARAMRALGQIDERHASPAPVTHHLQPVVVIQTLPNVACKCHKAGCADLWLSVLATFNLATARRHLGSNTRRKAIST